MFWGLVLKANKRYSQQVTKAFHVSQAALDFNTVNEKDGVVQVWLHTDDTEHLLANVSRQNPQVILDLAFSEGETVAFYSKGNGTVHLSGYLIPEADDFDGFQIGDEEEDEEEESDEEVEAPKKQKEKVNKKQVKVVKASNEEKEEDDDDDGEENDDDDNDSSDLDMEGLNEELEDEEVEDEEDSDDDDDDDDEEDDDEDDEDDEDDSDEIEAPPAKVAKVDKAAKQNGLTNGKAPKKENEQKPKNQQKNQKQEKQDQKPKKQQQNQSQKPTPKTLAGGVTIEDLRIGKGPEAKSGRKVSVYYEGRLKNNKVFDSTKSGEGFKFVLGRGEVIRGWDIGVAGMKVGSKRRITCPPSVAYGSKGAPPQIPPNSTLVFDVELRGVN